MDDLSGALTQLLSNKDSLNNILSLVSSFMNSAKTNQDEKAVSTPAPALPAVSTQKEPANEPNLSSLLENLSPAASDPQQEAASDDSSAQFTSALSGLSQILGGLGKQGSGDAQPDRSSLLIALKPYLRPARASQVDRAIRMLNTAYTVRTAMKTLGGNKPG